MATTGAVIDLEESDDSGCVIDLDAMNSQDFQALAPARRPHDPNCAGTSGLSGLGGSRSPDEGGIVIDLSDGDAYVPGDAGGAIDLTADDVTLARQMQRFLDVAVDLTASDEFDLLLAYRNGIDRFLRESSPEFRVREIFHNPHSQPGTPLYERFFAAYKKCHDKSIKLVFHGTSEENVDAICRSSLDPHKRGAHGQALGKGEYFAENLLISLPYCKGGRKLLVFAVIMDQSGLREHNTPGILVCHKSGHHLPLAVITLDQIAGLISVGLNSGLPQGMPGGLPLQLMQRFGLGGLAFGAAPPPRTHAAQARLPRPPPPNPVSRSRKRSAPPAPPPKSNASNATRLRTRANEDGS
jgi:hypothetical protein